MFPKANIWERSNLWKETSSDYGSSLEVGCIMMKLLIHHFVTIVGKQSKKVNWKATSKDVALFTKGFNNWKDATNCFHCHEQCKCHLESLEIIVKLPNSVPNNGEVLSTAHAHGKSTNRKIFFKILQNIQFLACQGFALRGHDDKESNFLPLFKLQRSDNHDISI